MTQKFNIRLNNDWVNILKSSNIELDNTKGYFSSTNTEDVLNELYERFMLEVVNKELSIMSKGQPVYITGTGDAKFAYAFDDLSINVAGFVYSDLINPDASGLIKTEGIISMSISEWNTVLDDPTPNGLVEGQNYFVSQQNPGKITYLLDYDLTGSYIIPVGKALTQTHFKIDVDNIIGL